MNVVLTIVWEMVYCYIDIGTSMMQLLNILRVLSSYECKPASVETYRIPALYCTLLAFLTCNYFRGSRYSFVAER